MPGRRGKSIEPEEVGTASPRRSSRIAKTVHVDSPIPPLKKNETLEKMSLPRTRRSQSIQEKSLSEMQDDLKQASSSNKSEGPEKPIIPARRMTRSSSAQEIISDPIVETSENESKTRKNRRSKNFSQSEEKTPESDDSEKPIRRLLRRSVSKSPVTAQKAKPILAPKKRRLSLNEQENPEPKIGTLDIIKENEDEIIDKVDEKTVPKESPNKTVHSPDKKIHIILENIDVLLEKETGSSSSKNDENSVSDAEEMIKSSSKSKFQIEESDEESSKSSENTEEKIKTRLRTKPKSEESKGELKKKESPKILSSEKRRSKVVRIIEDSDEEMIDKRDSNRKSLENSSNLEQEESETGEKIKTRSKAKQIPEDDTEDTSDAIEKIKSPTKTKLKIEESEDEENIVSKSSEKSSKLNESTEETIKARLRTKQQSEETDEELKKKETSKILSTEKRLSTVVHVIEVSEEEITDEDDSNLKSPKKSSNKEDSDAVATEKVKSPTKIKPKIEEIDDEETVDSKSPEKSSKLNESTDQTIKTRLRVKQKTEESTEELMKKDSPEASSKLDEKNKRRSKAQKMEESDEEYIDKNKSLEKSTSSTELIKTRSKVVHVIEDSEEEIIKEDDSSIKSSKTSLNVSKEESDTDDKVKTRSKSKQMLEESSEENDKPAKQSKSPEKYSKLNEDQIENTSDSNETIKTRSKAKQEIEKSEKNTPEKSPNLNEENDEESSKENKSPKLHEIYKSPLKFIQESEDLIQPRQTRLRTKKISENTEKGNETDKTEKDHLSLEEQEINNFLTNSSQTSKNNKIEISQDDVIGEIDKTISSLNKSKRSSSNESKESFEKLEISLSPKSESEDKEENEELTEDTKETNISLVSSKQTSEVITDNCLSDSGDSNISFVENVSKNISVSSNKKNTSKSTSFMNTSNLDVSMKADKSASSTPAQKKISKSTTPSRKNDEKLHNISLIDYDGNLSPIHDNKNLIGEDSQSITSTEGFLMQIKSLNGNEEEKSSKEGKELEEEISSPESKSNASSLTKDQSNLNRSQLLDDYIASYKAEIKRKRELEDSVNLTNSSKIKKQRRVDSEPDEDKEDDDDEGENKKDSSSSNNDSEDETSKNIFLDDMASEGSEDTPSTSSNELIIAGESVDTSSGSIDSDDTYENDSFVVDSDVEDEDLLSGNEDFLGLNSKKKRSRIIEIVSSEEELDKMSTDAFGGMSPSIISEKQVSSIDSDMESVKQKNEELSAQIEKGTLIPEKEPQKNLEDPVSKEELFKSKFTQKLLTKSSDIEKQKSSADHVVPSLEDTRKELKYKENLNKFITNLKSNKRSRRETVGESSNQISLNKIITNIKKRKRSHSFSLNLEDLSKEETLRTFLEYCKKEQQEKLENIPPPEPAVHFEFNSAGLYQVSPLNIKKEKSPLKISEEELKMLQDFNNSLNDEYVQETNTKESAKKEKRHSKKIKIKKLEENISFSIENTNKEEKKFKNKRLSLQEQKTTLNSEENTETNLSTSEDKLSNKHLKKRKSQINANTDWEETSVNLKSPFENANEKLETRDNQNKSPMEANIETSVLKPEDRLSRKKSKKRKSQINTNKDWEDTSVNLENLFEKTSENLETSYNQNKSPIKTNIETSLLKSEDKLSKKKSKKRKSLNDANEDCKDNSVNLKSLFEKTSENLETSYNKNQNKSPIKANIETSLLKSEDKLSKKKSKKRKSRNDANEDWEDISVHLESLFEKTNENLKTNDNKNENKSPMKANIETSLLKSEEKLSKKKLRKRKLQQITNKVGEDTSVVNLGNLFTKKSEEQLSKRKMRKRKALKKANEGSEDTSVDLKNLFENTNENVEINKSKSNSPIKASTETNLSKPEDKLPQKKLRKRKEQQIAKTDCEDTSVINLGNLFTKTDKNLKTADKKTNLSQSEDKLFKKKLRKRLLQKNANKDGENAFVNLGNLLTKADENLETSENKAENKSPMKEMSNEKSSKNKKLKKDNENKSFVSLKKALKDDSSGKKELNSTFNISDCSTEATSSEKKKRKKSTSSQNENPLQITEYSPKKKKIEDFTSSTKITNKDLLDSSSNSESSKLNLKSEKQKSKNVFNPNITIKKETMFPSKNEFSFPKSSKKSQSDQEKKMPLKPSISGFTGKRIIIGDFINESKIIKNGKSTKSRNVKLNFIKSNVSGNINSTNWKEKLLTKDLLESVTVSKISK